MSSHGLTMGQVHPHLAADPRLKFLADRMWPGIEASFVPRGEPVGDRVRVGLACPCLVQGGAEAWQLALARAVDPGRISWRGLVVIDPGANVDPAMRSAFEAIMPVGIGVGAAKLLADRCDILVSWAVEGLRGLTRSASGKLVNVAVCHAPAQSGWGRSVYARTDPDRFVAVSELALEAIPEPDRSKSAVIWNCVDETRLIQARSVVAMRASWGVPEGVKVVGLYQRHSDEKDGWAALRLAASLGDDWRVVFVGQGWLRGEMERVARLDPAHDNLIFADADPAAGDVLRAFDCLLVPSDYESFGLSMAEALRVGTPVISTPVGLAKLHPELTRTIPHRAESGVLAAAVLADRLDVAGTADRVARARSFAVERLSIDRFGRDWTGFLTSLVPEPMAPEPMPARLARVSACRERGNVLPLSIQADCGCLGRELSECRAGRGPVPGRVTLADCLACVGGA